MENTTGLLKYIRDQVDLPAIEEMHQRSLTKCTSYLITRKNSYFFIHNIQNNTHDLSSPPSQR